MPVEVRFYTSEEVADMLGQTSQAVSRRAQRHGIGQRRDRGDKWIRVDGDDALPSGVWLFTAEDIETMRQMPRLGMGGRPAHKKDGGS